MILFFIVINAIYVLFIVAAIVGWIFSENKTVSISNHKNFSILIPFRNEEKKIGVLLQTLSENFKGIQIVLVNDHSIDNTCKLIEEYICLNKNNNIKLVQAQGMGKKNAIAEGVEYVNENYIFLTDADCTFSRNGVQQLSGCLNRSGMVYAMVSYENSGNSFFQKIMILDLFAINGVALGLGNLGLHTYCSAANIFISKNVLLQSQNELKKSSNLSGDDLTLMKVVNKNNFELKACLNKNCLVKTLAPYTLGEFFKQRLRWGQKASGYKNLMLLALTLTVFIQCLSPFLALIAYISGYWSNTLHWLWVPGLVIDFLLLFLVSYRLGYVRLMAVYFPAWLLNLIYIPVIGLVGLFYSGEWRGRKIRN